MDEQDLLSAWEHWTPPDQPPLLLDADWPYFESARSRRAMATIADWNSLISAEDFGEPGERELHLSLIPQPFSGDLKRASVYLLLLNPGLGAWDYYGEDKVPEFRQTLLDNLRQRFTSDRFPFLWLDPQFSWHGGFAWWHTKLAKVIQVLAEQWSVSFSEARTRLAAELASIELFPYHSASFHDADGWLRRLPSVQLARSFVQTVVLERVRRHDAIVIVTRQANLWGLPAEEGITTYTAQQARAAHMTPDSPGGVAIIGHLTKRRSA